MRRLNCFYCRADRYTCVIFVYSLWMGNLEATLIPLYYTILISHLGGSTWQKYRIRPICVWGCQAYSLGQVASNSDYLVFEANFMEGPAHTEPENRLLLLCSTQRHQTWKHKTEGTSHHGSVDATRGCRLVFLYELSQIYICTYIQVVCVIKFVIKDGNLFTVDFQCQANFTLNTCIPWLKCNNFVELLDLVNGLAII